MVPAVIPGVLGFVLLAGLVISAGGYPPGLMGGSSPRAAPGGPSLFGTVDGPQLGTWVRPVAGTTPVTLVLGLEPRNLSSLQRFLAQVEDPSSPEFRHFLDLSQFEDRFAPSEGSVQEVVGYFQAHGAKEIAVSPDRMVISLVLPEADLATVFHTYLGWYASPQGYDFYAAAAPPQVPGSLAGVLDGLEGLSDWGNFQWELQAHLLKTGVVSPLSPNAGVSPDQYDILANSGEPVYWASDLQAIYQELPLLQRGNNGTGLAVATLLSSGYNETASGGQGENLPPWNPQALELYYEASFPPRSALPVPHGVPVGIDGVIPPAPGAPPEVGGVPLSDDSGAVDENSLDLETLGSLAPGAALYTFYFAESLAASGSTSLSADFDMDLNAALAYNYSSDHLVAISNSWGLPDTNDTVWNGLAQMAAAMGITLIASSGDQGDAPPALQDHPQGQWPPFPATAAYNTYGVLAVGGTHVVVQGKPTGVWNPNSSQNVPEGYDAPNITGIASESAWFSPSPNPSQYAGTEGGISSVINEPLWQARSAAQPTIHYTAERQGIPYARAIPDVAALGDQLLVFTAIQGTSYVTYGIFEGTSISAPVWAALVAVMAQADNLSAGFGYLDPAIYAVGGYFEAHGSLASPLREVLQGNNYAFNASVGWDPLTGWGEPVASALAPALLNRTYLGYVFNPNATPGIAHPIPTPKGSLNLPPWVLGLLGLGGILALAVVVALATSQRRRHQPAPPGIMVRSIQPPPPGSPGPPWQVETPPPYAPLPGRESPEFSQPSRHCSRCGAPLPTGATYCPWCGSPVYP